MITRLWVLAIALFVLLAVGPKWLAAGIVAVAFVIGVGFLMWFIIAMLVFEFEDRKIVRELRRDAERRGD